MDNPDTSPTTKQHLALKAAAGSARMVGRNIEDMVAEALNLLFAKYRKAELAPRKASK